ncbi:MAG: hypothetical protein Kow0059_08390 [Candidatus Sumerlaeia bacterium]
MARFKRGEKVVEPSIGLCDVEGVRRMNYDGKEQDYYILKAAHTRLYVPVDRAEKQGIRRPMTADEVKKIHALLKQPVSPNRTDSRLQYLNYREIIKSGDPQKISRLLRDLYILEQSDDLKGKERDIMEQAKRFLCDEITFVKNQPKTKVMEQINESLRAMYKKKVAKDREKAQKRKKVTGKMVETKFDDQDVEEDEEE